MAIDDPNCDETEVFGAREPNTAVTPLAGRSLARGCGEEADGER
jgi:hypothetical protein